MLEIISWAALLLAVASYGSKFVQTAIKHDNTNNFVTTTIKTDYRLPRKYRRNDR